MQSLAGGVGAIAELEPRQRIEQVVQAEGDEETVDGAEYESGSWVGPWAMMKPPTCLLNSQSKAGK